MSPAPLCPVSANQLHALCGLSATVLDRLLAVGGGRKPEQELLLTLIYLRHNVAQAVVRALFGVSADTSENTFYEVIAVLKEVCPAERWDAEKHWRKREPSWTPTPADQVLIDSFETPVSRPSQDEAQRRTKRRRCYSGKKKWHTLKPQAVTNGAGEVLELDPGHRGPRSDKNPIRNCTRRVAWPNVTPKQRSGPIGVSRAHRRKSTPQETPGRYAFARAVGGQPAACPRPCAGGAWYPPSESLSDPAREPYRLARGFVPPYGLRRGGPGPSPAPGWRS